MAAVHRPYVPVTSVVCLRLLIACRSPAAARCGAGPHVRRGTTFGGVMRRPWCHASSMSVLGSWRRRPNGLVRAEYSSLSYETTELDSQVLLLADRVPRSATAQQPVRRHGVLHAIRVRSEGARRPEVVSEEQVPTEHVPTATGDPTDLQIGSGGSSRTSRRPHRRTCRLGWCVDWDGEKHAYDLWPRAYDFRAVAPCSPTAHIFLPILLAYNITIAIIACKPEYYRQAYKLA